uniref:Uncharacterized protein LOC109697567 n=2 Tax=Castor canadensis TaxID=51338 RepID=A0A8B7VZK8_CASCN|nr:uncharacterized protein LOC109697567 [Castor canadensis]
MADIIQRRSMIVIEINSKEDECLRAWRKGFQKGMTGSKIRSQVRMADVASRTEEPQTETPGPAWPDLTTKPFHLAGARLAENIRHYGFSEAYSEKPGEDFVKLCSTVIGGILTVLQNPQTPVQKPQGQKHHLPEKSSAWIWCHRGCATDKLIFGQGTQLTVEPRIQPPTKPSVFIMKNGTKVACLVKDFYPKNVQISFKPSEKIAEFDPAIVISPSGKYSAVKLGQYEDSSSVTCSVQYNNETVHSTDYEPKKSSLDNPKPTETENVKQTSEPTCHEPRVHTEKVNMISLTVLGLRMLFAKSIAINFLLTAKLFFF